MPGDGQKGRVLAAMRSVSEPCHDPRHALEQACRALGVPAPRVRVGGEFRVSPTTTVLPAGVSLVAVCHAAAHLATDRVFPSHGAEFCRALVACLEPASPYQAELLRHALDEGGCHRSPDQRRRAVIKAVRQRASDGTRVVRAVFDDPPQVVEGRMTFDQRAGTVLGEDLSRLRYLEKLL